MKALDLASKNNPTEALKVLESISMPHDAIEFHVFRGYLNSAVNHRESALKDLSYAIRLIEDSKSLSNDNKNYLLRYSFELCKGLVYGPDSAKELSSITSLDPYALINYDLVAKHLKLNFPLRDRLT